MCGGRGNRFHPAPTSSDDGRFVKFRFRPSRADSGPACTYPPFLRPKPDKMTNQLYYGDNLQVLRDCIAAESVDLVYLDPPAVRSREKEIKVRRFHPRVEVRP